jgi:phosphate-selective porin OprO and OprP
MSLSSYPVGSLCAALISLAVPVFGADARDEEIRLLRAQIEKLDARLKALEGEKIKTPSGGPAAASPKAEPRPVAVDVSKEVTSLRLRGLLQADSRWYWGEPSASNDTFLIRRARFYVEGKLGSLFSFHINPDFAGSAFTLQDAWLNLEFSKAVQLRFGRFKTPIGLEQLQSDSWAFFVERSMVTGLVPMRDVGVQLFGDLADGRLSYAFAIQNGVADGASASNAGDYDDGKDFAARIFAHPFKNLDSPISGLGVGAAATWGEQETAAALTSGYRTDAQQVFFRYRNGVTHDGELWRVSPQAYYFYGPVGMIAEYVASTVNVRPPAGGRSVELRNSGWQLSGSYVLTGEKAAYAGVVPKHPYSPGAGTWGAWEVAARLVELDMDDAAFPVFADPSVSAYGATGLALGLNWYPTASVRASISYFHTEFDSGNAAPGTVISTDGDAVLTRLQLNF